MSSARAKSWLIFVPNHADGVYVIRSIISEITYGDEILALLG